MCLVFHAREATKDVDALLVPASVIRAAAGRVGEREGLPIRLAERCRQRLFSQTGRFEIYAEMSNLRIFAPHPEYLSRHEVSGNAARRGSFKIAATSRSCLNILKIKRIEDARRRASRGTILWIDIR